MRFSTFIKQSELIQIRLSTINTQLSEFASLESLSEKQIAKIKLYASTSAQKYNEFEKLVNKLYNTTPLPEDIDDTTVAKLQNTISDTYILIQSSASVLLPEQTRESQSDSTDLNNSLSTPNASNTTVSVNLPRLELPKFTGQPDRWISFQSLFENTVHKNENISNVEKFSYLLSCLSDEPLSLVKSLPLTNANYVIAWQKLLKRYHNSRILITLHVNNLLDIPMINNVSVKQVRSFLSHYTENSQALLALGHDINNESLIITSYMLRKCCHELRTKFEHSRNNSKNIPTIQEFVDFLENECLQIEAASLASTTKVLSHDTTTYRGKYNNAQNKLQPFKPTKVAMLTSTQTQLCTYCSAPSHNIYRCNSFSALNVQDRQAFIKSKMLCQNCFGTHKLNDCKSTHNCSVCNKRHHSMLHFTQTARSHAPNISSSVYIPTSAHRGNTSDKVPSDFVGISSTNNSSTVLLATALVLVSTEEGNSTVARAILDSAAQTTFITENCAKTLHLQRSRANGPVINGIASSQVKTKGISHVTLSSLSGYQLAKSHPVTILDKITGDLPKAQLNPEIKSKLKNLVLADPTFDTTAPIDLLIGADLFALCLEGSRYQLGNGMPIAMNTVFGFVIIGSASTVPNKVSENALVSLLTLNDQDINSSIQRFWTLEEPPHSSKISDDDRKCEDHFISTHTRTKSGRYVCRLPFKSDPTTELGNSSNTALSMFFSLERKFKNQPELKELYVNFITDYLQCGHMSLCTSLPLKASHYFLPHHGVFKENRIRVVFNASAPTSTTVSLNDILYPGPKLHNEISDIILQFRFHKIVFTCDIRQMFRQIVIHEEDQPYQLIYWREDESHPINIYKLTTVTYGMKSSPYLANRVVQQLIADEGLHHPLAARALSQQIYVDDALLGCDTEEEAILLQQEVVQLLSRGGFELRKWSSNSQRLLEAIPKEHRETPLLFRTQEQPCFSVLGLRWNPTSDAFSYTITTPTGPICKRSVLSSIAQIYDPSGWLNPVVLWAKCLMQHLWSLGLQWDEPLPSQISVKWNKFATDLKVLETIQIMRHVPLATAVDIQLHGFSDASERAYAACVYLRLQDCKDCVSTHLLIAKSRVAPLKRISLPRLELCGAHMLSKLMNYCATHISKQYKLNSMNAWCDSTITLSWIRTPSYRLKVFVGNRVSEIQDLTSPEIWSYVESAQNPADCASRGIMPSELAVHSLWWKGPKWLYKPSQNWPHSHFNLMMEDSLPEIKPQPLEVLLSVKFEFKSLLEKFSSWTTLCHVMAYILRFISNTKYKRCTTGTITLSELNSAINRICWLIQRECFPQDIHLMKIKKPCTSRIQRLAPFMDDEGIIRVGGRLKNASITFNAKHPILLPKKHHCVDLIIGYYHLLYLHAGPQFLQAMISQQFWILSARSIIRSCIFKCIRCFKVKPKVEAPFMGDLPTGRVTPTRPFSTSGIDYAGPFKVKLYTLKRLQPIKVYLCIFICFATKAVHIEVVTDLTTEAFIASLTRFISRRGLVSHIHCDCGTNFVGAAAVISKTFQEMIKQSETQRFAQENKVNFHFLPPNAPHQGGLWERAVRSAKYHLHRVIGTQVLTYEEFTTLTTRVEAILNSRPLMPLSADPNDLETLTPGHFLVGGPLTSIIEPQWTLKDIPLNRLRRWQLVQVFTQHIWIRWQQEYLHTLMQRSKWNRPQDNLKIGDLVILHDSNAPPLTWKMGRITAVSPGRDGIVRVVHLKTATGNFSRPAIKVSRLPIT